MQAVSAEVLERVKTLMVQEGVTLTDDLNQCEAAILEYVQQLGNTLLRDHFSKKSSAMRVGAESASAGRIKSL